MASHNGLACLEAATPAAEMNAEGPSMTRVIRLVVKYSHTRAMCKPDTGKYRQL